MSHTTLSNLAHTRLNCFTSPKVVRATGKHARLISETGNVSQQIQCLLLVTNHANSDLRLLTNNYIQKLVDEAHMPAL